MLVPGFGLVIIPRPRLWPLGHGVDGGRLGGFGEGFLEIAADHQDGNPEPTHTVERFVDAIARESLLGRTDVLRRLLAGPCQDHRGHAADAAFAGVELREELGEGLDRPVEMMLFVVDDRFAIVALAEQRIRQLDRSADPTVGARDLVIGHGPLSFER